MGELPVIPPPIPQEDVRPPTASLRLNPIRDSIRVAKGNPRPQPSKRTFTDNSTLNPEYSSIGFDLEPIMDAADPPTVPRYAGHTRKRSNTASSLGNGSFFDPMGTMRVEAFIDRSNIPDPVPQISRTTANAIEHPTKSTTFSGMPEIDLARSEDGSALHYRNDELFRGF